MPPAGCLVSNRGSARATLYHFFTMRSGGYFESTRLCKCLEVFSDGARARPLHDHVQMMCAVRNGVAPNGYPLFLSGLVGDQVQQERGHLWIRCRAPVGRVFVFGDEQRHAPTTNPTYLLESIRAIITRASLRCPPKQPSVEVRKCRGVHPARRAGKRRTELAVRMLLVAVTPKSDEARAELSPKSIVREGWNDLSFVYRPDGTSEDAFGHTFDDHKRWLKPILDRGAAGMRVLDLGCGCGIPDAKLLASRFRVTGVDISDVQIERATMLVPGASFVRADMTEVDFPPAHFGAVVCLYALIHVPLEEQRGLLRKIFAWLEPQGLFLLITGHGAWTGTESGWLGSKATMYWSHADAESYADWCREIGFKVLTRDFVPEGESGHELFLLEKTLPRAMGRPG